MNLAIYNFGLEKEKLNDELINQELMYLEAYRSVRNSDIQKGIQDLFKCQLNSGLDLEETAKQ